MGNLITEGVKSEIDNGLSNVVGYNFLKTVFANHKFIQKNFLKLKILLFINY